MDVRFWNPSNIASNAKLTLHITGKLGFSQGAIDLMKIDEKTYVKIGYNEKEKKDNNLYLMVLDNQSQGSIKVNKAGNYFYLNTRIFFNEMNIDYRKKKIIYDVMVLEKSIDNTLYKLIPRELDRKSKINK